MDESLRWWLGGEERKVESRRAVAQSGAGERCQAEARHLYVR
jgi:hypothetical protein